MRLLSVNIGQKRTQRKGNALETTGIYKVPENGAVQISSSGIQQDFICDQENHGGPDQAVYVYGATDYAWWSAELDKELAPGTFGENLTISGLESATFRIGDRLHVGATVLEVTAPRTPCSTLARRMGDSLFVKRYRYAERPGLYCRVIQEGLVRTGDEARLEPSEGETVTVLELFQDRYRRDKQVDTLRRFLRALIASRVRADLEKDLRHLLMHNR
jgi:MOSC domain-containing protein YiiM